MKSPAALGGAFLSEEREGSAVRIKNKNSFWSTFRAGMFLATWRIARARTHATTIVVLLTSVTTSGAISCCNCPTLLDDPK